METEQTDIFEILEVDAAEGSRLRHEGMARVLANPTNAEWKEAFCEGVIRLAQTGIPFCAEDVVSVVGMPPGNPNAIGAAINALARQGWISRRGIKPATRAKAHGRYVSVWGPGPKVNP